MFLKIAHHGARVLTLVTGFGLMTVLLIPGLTGDSSMTDAMHVRAAAIAYRRESSARFSSSNSPFPAPLTRSLSSWSLPLPCCRRWA